MTPEMYERCKATMFKKGNVPANTLPVGTEIKSSDGYRFVKVDDEPKAYKYDNWKLKHHLVWEEANGPVPEGCRVIFLDGDADNCSIENLAILTKPEHVLANRFGLRYSDPELTRTGVAAAKVLGKVSEIRKGKE